MAAKRWETSGGIVPATHSARQWAKGLQNDQRNRAPPKRVWVKGRQGASKETGFLARLSIGFPRPTTLPTTEKALGSGARGCRHSLLRRATRPCCCPSSLLQGKAGVFIPHPQECRGRPGAKCRRHGDPAKVESVAVGWLLLMIAGSLADHGEQRTRISGLGRREGDGAVICLVRVLSFSNAVDRSRSLPSSTGSVKRDLCSLSWCALRGAMSRTQKRPRSTRCKAGWLAVVLGGRKRGIWWERKEGKTNCARWTCAWGLYRHVKRIFFCSEDQVFPSQAVGR